MREIPYPKGPDDVPPDLATPSPAYRRGVWAAVAGLVLFLLLYFGLAGWFAWSGVAYLLAARHGGPALAGIALAAPSILLFIVLVKGLFGITRGATDGKVEVTAAEEPDLFAFVERVADEARAPRPHRIFLSPRVNAAVFYDLAIWNLVVPTHKNLEIGLGLVNVLSLDEFKAVIAHEFGHFGQDSMRVGTWVYLTRQAVGNLLTRRDGIDDLLNVLSRVDLRIAWIGWLLRLIVWSIRAVLETAFRGVLALERAMSRQMEFQADLVAATLTGSDSLVNGLHRLVAADYGFDRAAGFAVGEAAAGRAPLDLFALQTRVIEHMRRILDQPDYGATPRDSADAPAARRVFDAGVAEIPRMWASHPPNHEREQNLKARYLPSTRDDRSPWVLFRDPAAIRQRVTATALASVTKAAGETPMEASLAALDDVFDRPHYDPRYRGSFFQRAVTRHTHDRAALVAALPAGDAVGPALDACYPDAIRALIERTRELEAHEAQLKGLAEGFLVAPGGVIRFGGREVSKRELPGLLSDLAMDREVAEAAVQAHDRNARASHRAAAKALGQGHEAHLDGLLGLVFYAEHALADLTDANDFLGHTWAIVSADGNISATELTRLRLAAEVVHSSLARIWLQREDLQLGPDVAKRLGVAAWQELLPDGPALPPPTNTNMGQGWFATLEPWVHLVSNALAALRGRALDALVEAEAHVATCWRDGRDPGEAPRPAVLPKSPIVRKTGDERPRQKGLGAWDSFVTADGYAAGAARLGAASLVLTPALAVLWFAGEATVIVQNGLGVPVDVDFGGRHLTVPPHAHVRLGAMARGGAPVVTRTPEGALIEEFDAPVDEPFGTYVYNVASASALIEWTQVYGRATERDPRKLGAPRWSTTTADAVLVPPPDTVSTKGGGATRDVLAEFGPEKALQIDGAFPDDGERHAFLNAHATWDPLSDPDTFLALGALAPDEAVAVAEERLRRDGPAVALQRFRMDTSPAAHDALCATLPAPEAATDPDTAYLAARCAPDPAGNAAYDAAWTRWPEHPWLNFASGYNAVGRDDFQAGEGRMLRALEDPVVLAAVGDYARTDLVRLRRLTRPEVGFDDLAMHAPMTAAIVKWLTATTDAELPPLIAAGRQRAAGRFVDVAEPILGRFRGASAGADAAAIRDALDRPVNRPDLSVFVTAALAAREGRDPAPWLDVLPPGGAKKARLVANLAAVRADPALVDRACADVSLVERGHLRAMGVVLLGSAAPPAWRREAEALLFPWERPWFGP